MIYYLDVLYGRITERTKNVEVLFEYTLSKDSYLDDVVGRKLFNEVLPKLGSLKSDECYAFVPALALGGSYDVKSLQKVKLREHLAMLRQLVKVEIIK